MTELLRGFLEITKGTLKFISWVSENHSEIIEEYFKEGDK